VADEVDPLAASWTESPDVPRSSAEDPTPPEPERAVEDVTPTLGVVEPPADSPATSTEATLRTSSTSTAQTAQRSTDHDELHERVIGVPTDVAPQGAPVPSSDLGPITTSAPPTPSFQRATSDPTSRAADDVSGDRIVVDPPESTPTAVDHPDPDPDTGTDTDTEHLTIGADALLEPDGAGDTAGDDAIGSGTFAPPRPAAPRSIDPEMSGASVQRATGAEPTAVPASAGSAPEQTTGLVGARTFGTPLDIAMALTSRSTLRGGADAEASPLDGPAAVQRDPHRPGLPTARPTTARPTTARPTTAPAPNAGDIAVDRGIAQRSPDGSVIFDLGAAPEAASPVEAPPVQMDAAASPAPASAAPAPGGGAGGSAGAAGGSEAELDELSRRIYGRIRLQLRNELRLDRERSGSLIDIRR